MISDSIVSTGSAFRNSKKVGNYLRTFFDQLNVSNIQYCVLHGYEGLPDYALSDVDIVVDSGGLKRFEKIVFDVAKLLGFQVMQKLYYDIPKCYFYVIFFRDNDGRPGFVQLDVLNDDYGIGSYILKTQTLLEGRRKYKCFFIPSLPVEACYLLIKKVVKGKFLTEHIEKLKALFLEDEIGVRNIISRYFGKGNVVNFFRLIDEGINAIEHECIIKKLKYYLFLRYSIFKPHLLMLNYLWHAKRVTERAFSPTGLVVVFLSPDGGGKSTITDMILDRLRYGFRNTKKIHWRPYLLPPPRKLMRPTIWNEMESPNNTPHNLPPKKMASSVLRLIYYFFDYLIGYFPKVLWLKIRTHLVVFERYYYDFLIDTKRFRLNIPGWLPKLLLPFVPKEDVLFLLTGSAEILYTRKQEISFEEIKRQLNVIDNLSLKHGNVHKINIDQPIENEMIQIENIIIDVLEKRLKKRSGQISSG